MIIVGWILVLILSYLIGSLPSGLIVGQAGWKTDLRKRGSGNIGATNAWRVLGPRAGMLVFAMDFLKGVIPVVIASHLVGTPWSLVMAGGMALIGHVASIFIQFKGGKAVATGLGVITAMVPHYGSSSRYYHFLDLGLDPYSDSLRITCINRRFSLRTAANGSFALSC